MNTILLHKVSAPPVDQGLLNQAMGFFNAASRCFSNVAITPRIDNSPMAAGIVCAAFSVEMYLKLLAVLGTGKYSHGHKLAELYAELPAETRTKLTAKYGSADVEKHIGEVSAAFVEWRYEHEHESLNINPSVLVRLAKACHALARELKPELRVFGENATV